MLRGSVASSSRRSVVLAPAERLELRTMMAGSTPEECWVDAVYQDALGRPAEQSGLDFYTAELAAGSTRTQVALKILSSREAHEYTVKQVFEEILDRPIDPGAVDYYADLLDAGESLDDVKSLLLGSPEYYNKVGGTNDAFLEALYQDVLGRNIDPFGEALYKSWLAFGVSRKTIAWTLLKSVESNGEVTEDLYQQWLGREPDTAGKLYFTGWLQVGVSEARVSAALAASDEYFDHWFEMAHCS